MELESIDKLKKKLRLDTITDKLIIFYVLIVANFLNIVFSCELQHLLKTNAYALHIAAFVVLYTSVVIVDYIGEEKSNPLKILGWAFLLYIIFLISTHTNFKFFLAALAVVFLMFVVNNIQGWVEQTKHKNADTNNNKVVELTSKTLNNIKVLGEIVFMSLILYGFLVNIGEQSMKHKGNWSWIAFLFNISCNKFKNLPVTSKHDYFDLAQKGLLRIFTGTHTSHL